MLGYPFRKRIADAALQAAWRAACSSSATWVEDLAHSPTTLPLCRDPDDQKFLALAGAVHADMLLTRDHALLELQRRASQLPFSIVTPRQFVSVCTMADQRAIAVTARSIVT